MNYEKNIVLGLLKQPKRLLFVIDLINLDYFSSKIFKLFYKNFKNYYVEKGNFVNEEILKDIIGSINLDSDKKTKEVRSVLLNKLTEIICEEDIADEEFKYSVEELLKNKQKQIIKIAIERGADFLVKEDIDKAINILADNVSDAKLITSIGSAGRNAKRVASEYKRKYQNIEEGGLGERVKIPFNIIQEITAGGKRGDFWIIGSYTGDGKTQFLKECAYDARMNKKNVVFISLEMSDEEMMLMFLTRHSHKFKDGGLYYSHIERGMLSKQDKEIYFKTLDDWENNDEYGQIYIWYPDIDITVSDIRARLEAIQTLFNIDLVVIDYDELIEAERKRSDQRLEMNEVLRKLKNMAGKFNNNLGFFMLCAHQMSRSGYDKACERGFYVLGDLGITSGTEKNANLIMWILRTEEMKEQKECLIGISKYRTGAPLERGVRFFEDYATSYIGDLE